MTRSSVVGVVLAVLLVAGEAQAQWGFPHYGSLGYKQAWGVVDMSARQWSGIPYYGSLGYKQYWGDTSHLRQWSGVPYHGSLGYKPYGGVPYPYGRHYAPAYNNYWRGGTGVGVNVWRGPSGNTGFSVFFSQ